MRIQKNLILQDYLKQKAKDPHGLREKLIELHEKQVNGDTVVSAAPNFVPSKYFFIFWLLISCINLENTNEKNEGISLLINE